MEFRRSTRTPPSPLITGVFRVCDAAKRPRLRGASFFVLLLAARGGRYAAIAGPQAARLSRGDLVRVRGCVLFRGGRPVLVVGSLDSIISDGQKPPQIASPRSRRAETPRMENCRGEKGSGQRNRSGSYEAEGTCLTATC